MTTALHTPTRPDFRHVVFAQPMRASNPIAELPPVVRGTVGGGRTRLSDPEATFLQRLFASAALDRSSYRDETLLRRLPACLRALHVESIDEASELIEQDPRGLAAALDALIIGVSSFFRDQAVFDALGARVLPELLESRANLRIWSAGCSDGQELYSIAMLLAEANALHRAELLGTDCRVAAIHQAELGGYDEAVVRALPVELQERYFVDEARGMRIHPDIRTVVRWRSGDVLEAAEPGAWDVILCRNLAMYLKPEAAVMLWERLYRALRCGGVLVLGRAERPTGMPFSPLLPCIFRKDDG